MKKTAHVIAHTHWDRSWYWPLERFRVRLLECVKAVIRELRAHPDYIFTFDGQTLMLEDYLETCPEDRGYLQQCAREGRIVIGPMYVLSDLYCTGGEALVRNLLIGARWCREFGAEPACVLHMPDTFGITPSIPMIARGFGMRAFSFMRGIPGEVPGLTDMVRVGDGAQQLDRRFFLWRSADGSEIPVITLREGYASAAARIGREPGSAKPSEERYASALVEAAKKWDDPPGMPVLLMAGVDHQIPWSGQKGAMERAGELGDYTFAFSTLDRVASEAFASGASNVPRCEGGEFHGDGAASVLGGTISARIYLKMANAAVEQMLLHQVEPAAAFLRLLGIEDASFALIRHAWKLLLRTHPHDDICGCSVDAVHRKNESDMQQARECADALRRRFFGLIMQRFGANRRDDTRPSFALVNFQPVARTGPSEVMFDFEGRISWGDMELPARYRIVGEDGKPVPFREIWRGASVEHPHAAVRLELYAPLPPFSMQRFYLEEIGGQTDARPGTPREAENEFFRVRLNANGSFDLTDKSSGGTRSGIGLFSSQGDVGDSYDFSDIPGECETVFEEVACELSRCQWPGGVVELSAAGVLPIPATTDPAKRSRSSEMALLPFKLTLVVAPGHPLLEVRVDFTNTAADHRLRWNLPTPGVPSASLAGLKFEVLERASGARPAGDKPPRIFPEHPADAFVAADGLACFSRFPFNYELVQQETPFARLAITVMRSVSYLCIPVEGATRPGTHAGPHTLVPEARCLGRRFSMSFALKFCEGCAGGLYRDALMWRAQPLYGQCDPTMEEYPLRSADVASEAETATGMPAIAGEGTVVSAFKPAEDGEGVIVRLHNATSQAAESLVSCGKRNITQVLLDETPEPAASSPAPGGEVRVQIPRFGLKTFRMS